jgi:hypothetical protein
LSSAEPSIVQLVFFFARCFLADFFFGKFGVFKKEEPRKFLHLHTIRRLKENELFVLSIFIWSEFSFALFPLFFFGGEKSVQQNGEVTSIIFFLVFSICAVNFFWRGN